MVTCTKLVSVVKEICWIMDISWRQNWQNLLIDLMWGTEKQREKSQWWLHNIEPKQQEVKVNVNLEEDYMSSDIQLIIKYTRRQFIGFLGKEFRCWQSILPLLSQWSDSYIEGVETSQHYLVCAPEKGSSYAKPYQEVVT